MIGSIIIRVAFGASLLAVLFYYLDHRKHSDRLLIFARSAYRTAVACMISAAALLIYLIMTHQFNYTYVWNYSSTDLPGPLLFLDVLRRTGRKFLAVGLLHKHSRPCVDVVFITQRI